MGMVHAPLASGPCGGAPSPSNLTGTLGVQGGPYPGPSVANRTVQVAYDYTLNYTPSGGSASFTCNRATATGHTDGSGRFSISIVLPASGCSPSCSVYTGPFGPLSFAVAGGDPPGYFVAASVNGNTVSVNYVVALGSASLTPFGRTTVSLLAPVTIQASALAGNGAPSPASVTYNWTLQPGTGWSIVPGGGGSTFTVISSVGAGVGTVTAYVNGTYNGSTEHAAAQDVVLTAVATKVIAASVAPTELDVGAPATFTLSGTGSAGYPYAATVYPSLGAANVTAPCTTTAAPGGTVSVQCAVSVTYPTRGLAQPTAELTNGFSFDVWTFSAVTVAPALVVSISPQPLQAYVGRNVTLQVTVSTGSGTAPYGPACYWVGDGRHLCAAAGSTSFSFDLRYFQAGRLTNGRVTIEDGAGVNRSFPVAVVVSAPPLLEAILVANGSVEAGTSVTLTSAYSGGASPASYWWNDSLLGSPLSSGTITRSGPLDLTFVPATAGTHDIRLTVIDGLGTLNGSLVTIVVTAGPARVVVPVNGVGPWTTPAGVAYNVSWAVVDPAGERVANHPVKVTLAPAAGVAPGSVWVNSTWGQPVGPDKSGDFVLDTSDWHQGFLNFSLGSRAAGHLVFNVLSGLPVSEAPGGTVELNVVADAQHLLLTHPWTAVSNSGVNHTLYQIGDRFGNMVPSGYVVVRSSFGGVVSQHDSSIEWNGSVSTVWVNFTIPEGLSGSVVVLSALGNPLIAPVDFAAPAGAAPAEIALIGGLAVAAVLSIALGIRSRRPTERPGGSSSSGPDDDELERLAAGRAHILARADLTTPRTLAELAAGWTGTPIEPAELTEWVSSLVAEGSLRAEVGPGGAPRFVRASGPAPSGGLRVEMDPKALEEALARRPEPETDDEPAGPGANR